MNIRNTVLAAALLGTMGFSQSSMAITIDGITFAEGANFETLDLFQGRRDGGAVTAVGDELIGIGIVNRILDADNNVLWENGDNGRELTVYFQGYFAESLTTQGVGDSFLDRILFSGGSLSLFSDSTQDFSGSGTQATGIASATDGSLFLALAGSPIGGLGDNTGDPITLASEALRNSGDPFTNSFNITGRGLLDVTGGSAASFFNTNTFGCVG
ncbi:MAG: hypothetical protein H0X43_04685, partial [Nitrosospira sp.]|nr:hypothetical protein [Nitrosospira sp.]